MLVTFEGLDGSGKSTQVSLLQSHLQRAGRPVQVFREPGGTALGEQVRRLLLDPDLSIDPFAEMLLFSAARSQLSRSVISPALSQGQVVICDRYFDSTTAYQGSGRGVASAEWLKEFHHIVTGGVVPDRTYLLDLPAKVARERQLARAEADRMEQSKGDFFERVRKAYLALAAREPHRFVVINAMLSVEDIHQRISSDADGRLLGSRSESTHERSARPFTSNASQ
ncbi:dTMP kinase [soil metagenome]